MVSLQNSKTIKVYNEIRNFLTDKMRMSHIYQPVMIKKLIDSKGKTTDEEIARELLKYDPSQVEYYQKVTNNMVGRVLRNHKVVSKENSEYRLNGYDSLSISEIEQLRTICEDKIAVYIEKRGKAIWEHRRRSRIAISGTIRYEVLKRAKFRCELCGVSAGEKALEVDHITPKNFGGDDSINNYQSLCYSCNASKGDRDDTDFRGQSNLYELRNEDCVFCNLEKDRIVDENNLAYLIRDKYPVTRGHSLIIPKRHFDNYFDTNQAELNSINYLMQSAKRELEISDPTIKGFNVGINCGLEAGQTVFHTHIHLIPRRTDDVANPIGGVRNIINGKGNYRQ